MLMYMSHYLILLFLNLFIKIKEILSARILQANHTAEVHVVSILNAQPIAFIKTNNTMSVQIANGFLLTFSLETA